MLIILNDPAGITGRSRHDLDPGKTLQANIAAHLSSGFECDLKINGEAVDPLTDARLDAPPAPGDVVIVTRRPAGLDPFTSTLLTYEGTKSVVNALVPSPEVSYNYNYSSSSVSGKDSPNNSLTAQANVARAYQAIPDVYGYRRVWPDMIQPSSIEYVDHIKYVTEWLCVSRGKGTITAVQYSETPIADIEGASYEVFEPEPSSGYPEDSETILSDVVETFPSDDVNGQELEYPVAFSAITPTAAVEAQSGDLLFTVTVTDGPTLDDLKTLAPNGQATVAFTYTGPVSFSQTCTVQSCDVFGADCVIKFSSAAWPADVSEAAITVTITPLGYSSTQGPYTLLVECGRIRWNTIFLRGLKGSVTVRAQWWQLNDSGYEVIGSRQGQDDTYTADTFDQRFYTKEVTPAAGFGRYRVQFTRLTAQIGDGSADVAKIEEVYAVRHYATKTLPGVTVIRVTTKATNQATGFSERKFNVRWSRHVRTLTSNTLSPSRNFARIMAHIWTLAGNDISGLNTTDLAAINAKHGEDSPLLRFDASIDDADLSLGERLQLVAGTVRGTVWRDGTTWTVTREELRDYPELQFDYRNLAGAGDSVISYASHLPASSDGVEIEYADEATQSKKAYVRLNITTGAPVAGTSSNPKKIRMQGCVTAAQATNRAHLEARRLLYQRTSVSDTSLSDAGALGLGSLVRWIDPNDFGGDDGLQAGEVLSIAGDVITTSETIDWKGQTSGRITFTGVTGARLGAPVVCYPDAAGVRLASVPAGIYTATPERQCGSRYAFAVGLTEAEMEAAGLYTVVSIKPAQDGKASLGLVAYDARMFEED